MGARSIGKAIGQAFVVVIIMFLLSAFTGNNLFFLVGLVVFILYALKKVLFG